MEIETCRALLPRVLPDVPVRTTEVLTAGWDSVVLDVNDEWIVRFARREETAIDMRREAALLPVLAPQLAPVAVPGFAAPAGPPRAGDAVVYRKLHGHPLGAGAGASSALGAFISCLHAIPTDGLPERWRTPEESWRLRTETDVARARAVVWPSLPASLRAYLDRTTEALLAELVPEPVSALLHGDLTPANVLVEPGSQRIVAVIDWGDAMLGDPAYDLGVVVAAVGRSFGEQVAAACAASAPARRRMLLYARLRPLEHLVFAVVEGDSELAARLVRRIDAESRVQ